jgi:hypothetical protein
MKQILDILLRLQNLELGIERAASGTGGPEQLRKSVPAPILEHYDRLRTRGKKGVAIVKHGVCGQCHMQVALGLQALLRRDDSVQRCETCGAFLYRVEEVPQLEPPPRAVKPGRRGRPRKNAVPAAPLADSAAHAA